MDATYPITAATSQEVYRHTAEARELYGESEETLALYHRIDSRLRRGGYQYQYCQIGHDGTDLCLLAGTEFWDSFGDMEEAR